MTTLAYNNVTKVIGADTRLTYDNYYGFCSKILFPKRGIVLATAGNASDGEWLRFVCSKPEFKIHDLYTYADKPKLDKSFSAFIWDGKPWMVDHDLNPMPIEHTYWCGGSGGSYAMAYLHIGFQMHEAIAKAAEIDYNSGPPIHIVKLDVPATKHKIEVYFQND